MSQLFGAEFRRVENCEHLGKPAIVAVAVRSYDTTVHNLWDAVKTPERLARWDLALHGFELHFADPATPLDHEAVEAWTQSSEGKAFMRSSGEAWGAAHAASGEDLEAARAKAERTIAAHTGA
jgi:hypothetical protein